MNTLDQVLTLHVSASGSDSNPGTEDRPLATLRAARDAIRTLRQPVDETKPVNEPPNLMGRRRRNSNPKGELPEAVRVLLADGRHQLDETFRLNVHDCATAQAPIIYEAAPGAKPVLSGGFRVTRWSRHAGPVADVWKAHIADHRPEFKFRQLFVNGEPMIRSRWPKAQKPTATDPDIHRFTGWAMCAGYVDQGIPGQRWDQFHYKPEDFPRIAQWSKPDQLEVYSYACHAFTQITPVHSFDTTQRLITLMWNIQTDNLPRPTHETRFFIENILEELSEPGEWCFDAETKTLFLKMPEFLAGKSPDEVEVIVPRIRTLVELQGVNHTTFRGLTFAQTRDGDDHLRDKAVGYGAQQVHQAFEYCGEAILLQGCEDCTITGNTFDTVGGNGIVLHRRNRHHTISRNVIRRAGAYGFVAMGRRDDDYPALIDFTDNEIDNPGFRHQYTTAIFTGLSDSLNLSHNFIHDCPQYAVNLGNNGFGRNYLQYNEIRRTNLEKLDAGAISFWMDIAADGESYFPPTTVDPHAERSGHVIRYNLIADTEGCFINPETDELMRDNARRKHFFNMSSAIYTDDMSSNCVITHNLIIRSGRGMTLHTNKHQLVENNLIIDCLWGLVLCNAAPMRGEQMRHTHVDFMTGNRVVHNVITTTRPDIALDAFRFDIWVPGAEKWDIFQACDENLYHSAAAGWQWRAEYNGWNLTSQQFFSLAEWRSLGKDRQSVVADPKLVPRFDLGPDRYELAPDSPAWDLGWTAIPIQRIGNRAK